jgi:hypothetical protein
VARGRRRKPRRGRAGKPEFGTRDSEFRIRN